MVFPFRMRRELEVSGLLKLSFSNILVGQAVRYCIQ